MALASQMMESTRGIADAVESTTVGVSALLEIEQGRRLREEEDRVARDRAAEVQARAVQKTQQLLDAMADMQKMVNAVAAKDRVEVFSDELETRILSVMCREMLWKGIPGMARAAEGRDC